MSDVDAQLSDRATPPEPDGSIQTVSGRWLNPLAPDPASIDVGDIAQALANQCRFGGHSRAFYSVAQHSTIVSDVCAERGATAAEALAALLHDAGEAYLVDLPHPLKHRSALGPPYREAEKLLEEAIRARFDLVAQPAEMKPIDRSLLATERRTFASTIDAWPELEGFEPLEIEIEPWEPPRARREFLERFERLDAARRPV
jgi:5'-deoxynucleotidase YfbR-like HD superfamily hydrolase